MAGPCVGLLLTSLGIFGTTIGAESSKYVIEAPDSLRILAYALPAKAELVDGEHRVGPAGTVSLGEFGSVWLDGLTVDQARAAIAKQLSLKGIAQEGLRVRVDLVKSDSKVCYVIVPGKDGNQIYRFPLDGHPTVASAILEIEGLAALATKNGVWVSRSVGKERKTLKVDWQAISGAGRLASNYRLEASDRVFVGSNPSK